MIAELVVQNPKDVRDSYRTLDLVVRRKDRSTVWTEMQMKFFLDEAEKPTGILGVTRDITERRAVTNELRHLNTRLEERVRERTADLVAEVAERKRIEKALRESEARYRAVLQQSLEAIYIFDEDAHRILEANSAFLDLLGYTAEEISNLTLYDIIAQDRSSTDFQLQEIMKGEGVKLGERQWQRKDGTIVEMEVTANKIRQAGRDLIFVVGRDITERKRTEERLAYDALHDVLTGLPNRILFMDRLGQRLERAKRHPDDLFAVLFIDLDQFKVINDSLGHSVGDEFLINTAKRLSSCLQPEDTISRFGGDEFVVLVNEVSEESDTVRVAERIHTQLESASMLNSLNRSSTASIGIAMYNSKYIEPQEMLRDADTAMYRAKALGGGRCQLFDNTMYENALLLLQMEADLKRAVQNREWRVYYQPIISLESGQITGAEALVRWNHPTRGLISPLDFIPIAEETGLIMQIGQHVLRVACAQARAWRDSGHPKLWVSVNISGRQFQEKNLLRLVEQTLMETDLPSEGLRLEITESVAMRDLDHTISILTELNRLGVSISLDDFGNGYSSLSYLKQFPLKVLKIDRSFIQEDDPNKSGEAITSAIIFMGQTLNMEVVAEGVETEEQLNFLKSQFCDEVQGFLFGQPMPSEEFNQVVER